MNQSTASPASPPNSPAPLRLRSPRLQVDIAAPGTLYRRSRFDWTGFITQVTLDGRHSFCMPESLDPTQGTGGIGLCNEFTFFTAADAPHIRPGQQFPKFGIGLLTRPNPQPYDFRHSYDIAPFPIQVDPHPDHITYTVEPLPCTGYAAWYQKTIRVEHNSLYVAYRFRNVGSLPISCQEYCHNFLGLAGHEVGPDFRLQIPFVTTFAPLPKPSPILTFRHGSMLWQSVPQTPFYCRTDTPFSGGEYRWELTHQPTGLTVAEAGDFTPARFALWGLSHVVSPEVFIALDLPPGAEKTWTRHYTFTQQ